MSRYVDVELIDKVTHKVQIILEINENILIEPEFRKHSSLKNVKMILNLW